MALRHIRITIMIIKQMSQRCCGPPHLSMMEHMVFDIVAAITTEEIKFSQ